MMDERLAARLERRKEILARVRALLVEKLDVHRDADEIDPDTPLFGEGLALDSIDAVDLAVHLKMDFGVDVPEDQSARALLRTVNTLVDAALAASEEADGHG